MDYKSALLKEQTTDYGEFSGYASVFNVMDSTNDVVSKGAFLESLQNVKILLWQHNYDQPIGRIKEIFEDEYGLYVKCQLLMSLEKAREAYELIRSGIIIGLSIGYTPSKKYMDRNGVRILKKINLHEVSLVTFPANSSAIIHDLKSASNNITKSLDNAISVLNIAELVI